MNAELEALLRGTTPAPTLEQALFGSIAPKAQVRAGDGVTRLAYGQTRRNPGYATEAEYLQAVRLPQPMRFRGSRQTHRRWAQRTPVTFLQPTPAVVRRRVTQLVANLDQPNLILGS